MQDLERALHAAQDFIESLDDWNLTIETTRKYAIYRHEMNFVRFPKTNQKDLTAMDTEDMLTTKEPANDQA